MKLSALAWVPNAVAFQLVWCAAVGGAANGWWWAGPLALALFAAVQLAVSRWRAADLRLMLFAALLGLAVDTLWVQLGWVTFRSPVPFEQIAPAWIIAMWMGFALTLNHSLSALKAHPAAAALFGLVGGPLAYWVAGSVWGAVDIVASWLPYTALAVAWGAITPLLLQLAQRSIAPAKPVAAI